MIKLEMELSDIDYEVLVKEILPKVADRLKQNGSPLAPLLSGGMAANVLLRASDSVRDRMAAEILNAAAPRLTGTLEKLCRRQRHSLQGAGPARDRRTKIKESAAPESLDFRGLRRFRENKNPRRPKSSGKNAVSGSSSRHF